MSFHLVYCLLLLQFVLGYAPFEHKSPGLNCFHDYDPSSLGNIDPDINYYTANNTLNSPPYYDDQTFRERNGNNINVNVFRIILQN